MIKEEEEKKKNRESVPHTKTGTWGEKIRGGAPWGGGRVQGALRKEGHENRQKKLGPIRRQMQNQMKWVPPKSKTEQRGREGSKQKKRALSGQKSRRPQDVNLRKETHL